MQIDPDTPSGGTLIPELRTDLESTHSILHQFLQENISPLLEIIRTYVIRVGLARGQAVQTVAQDVLNDAVIEALAHADRLNPTIQPRAWFLAIAANIIKRKKTEATKLQMHESLVSDLVSSSDGINENDFFDQFTFLTHPGPEHAVEMNEQVLEMLSLVSLDDRAILRLALLYDLDTNTLARVLGITPGAARVRLHRALNRLRIALSTTQQIRTRKR